jgi:iron(III) transport system substrate-binding protein
MVVVSQTHRMSAWRTFKRLWDCAALIQSGGKPHALQDALARIGAFLLIVLIGCGKSQRTVIVYTSQDQIYAEPVFAEFTRQTGIKVLPVFDSESVKTAGLAQRVIAERDNPRADIFWSNEEMISHHLAELGALDTNAWATAGFRTRRLIINTNFVSQKEAPKSLDELTNSKWAGKVALAYPIYGTTAAHFVALRQGWGDDRFGAWCKALVANRPFVVDGNSVVVRMVGAGEAWIGLTDSDDFAAGLHNNLPIASAPLCNDLLTVPSSVGIVRGAPHHSEAEAFYNFAQSEAAVKRLVADKALEGVNAPANAMKLKQPAAIDETRELLKTIFARE